MFKYLYLYLLDIGRQLLSLGIIEVEKSPSPQIKTIRHKSHTEVDIRFVTAKANKIESHCPDSFQCHVFLQYFISP